MSPDPKIDASEKSLSLFSGSDAVVGWGLLAVIYSVWFIFYPTSVKFGGIPVQEKATFFALLATILTYYSADWIDNLLWNSFKGRYLVPKEAAGSMKQASANNPGSGRCTELSEEAKKAVTELQQRSCMLGRGWPDELQRALCAELGIAKGTYHVATKLLAAADKDFACRTVNELAKVARSLAIFSFAYALIAAVGWANGVYPYNSVAGWLFAALIPLFVILYVWLKEQQRFTYYKRALNLVENSRNTKFTEARIGEHKLFFWQGKLVASAI